MQIIYGLNDLGFEAKDLDELKTKVEGFYGSYGNNPDVKIEDGHVVVTIDNESAEKADNCVSQAIAKCNKRRFDEAMKLLDEAVKITPCNSDIYRLKAQIYFTRDKDYDLALDTCIDALRFNPRDYFALTLMGNIMIEGKDDKESAMSYYKKALEYNPNDEIVATNIASLEFDKGNFDEANAIFQRLMKKDGIKSVNLYYNLVLTYIQRDKMQEAFELGVEGLKQGIVQPENPDMKDKLLKITYQVASELIQGINTKDVFEELKGALEAKLKLPLDIYCDNSTNAFWRLEYGPAHGKNYHCLFYKENAPAYALHTMLHELVHLEMLNEASKCNKNRIMLCGDEQYDIFCKTYQPFIKKIKSRFGEKGEEEICKLFNRFGLLIMNCPLDMFVEQNIHDNHPALRPFQFVGLYNQAMDYLQSVINPEIKKVFPEQIIHIVKICNMVTGMHIKALYGIDTIKQYNSTHQEMGLAEDLYDEFLAYHDYSAGEEYEYVQYFMEALRCRQYFIIKDEEEVVARQNLYNEALEAEANKDQEETDKANKEFVKEHPDEASSPETIKMAMFMVSALQNLSNLPTDKVKNIAVEINMVGVKGIDPNKSGYKIPSLKREFNGYELIAYYYVSVAIAMPERLDSLKLPFREAYKLARQMYDGGMKNI